jgi:hypothetical protein
MSLINEAPKKAQRQRSDPPLAGMSAGNRADHRDPPKRTQSVVLLVAGAAVLVVLSVMVTVYLVTRKPIAAEPVLAAAPTTPAAVAAVAPAVDLNAPAPVIVAPVIATPPPETEKAPPEPAVSAVVAAAPVEIPPIAPVRQPELSIQIWVDAIHVTGVRYSGGVNKVLMNDRVFKVNDIVDRTLVLKLVKIEPELLTFTDPNGMVYTKSF